MASVGPQSPTASANGTGGDNWSNPTNVYASDDARATVTLAGLNTDDLLITGFDFSAIPSGATIEGIVVEVEISCDTTAKNPRDYRMYLTKDGTTVVGANKAGGLGSTWPTTEAYRTYGASNDLWSTTWTDTELKASTFGFVLAAMRSTGKGGNPTVRVDHVRITVYYSTSVPTVVTPSTLALTLSTFAPSVLIGTVLVPTTLALSLTTFAPTVTVAAVPSEGGNPVVYPSTPIKSIIAHRRH